MDVNGVANSAMQVFMQESQRQNDAIGNFQSVLDKAMTAPGQVEDAAVREACEAFESYFLQTMFREMRKTSLDGGGLIGKSNAELIFTDMLDEEVSKQAAKSGGIGLADMMMRQLSRQYVPYTAEQDL